VRAGRDIEAIQYGSTILAAARSAPSDDELLQEAVTLLGCRPAYIFVMFFVSIRSAFWSLPKGNARDIITARKAFPSHRLAAPPQHELQP